MFIECSRLDRTFDHRIELFDNISCFFFLLFQVFTVLEMTRESILTARLSLEWPRTRSRTMLCRACSLRLKTLLMFVSMIFLIWIGFLSPLDEQWGISLRKRGEVFTWKVGRRVNWDDIDLDRSMTWDKEFSSIYAWTDSLARVRYPMESDRATVRRLIVEQCCYRSFPIESLWYPSSSFEQYHHQTKWEKHLRLLRISRSYPSDFQRFEHAIIAFEFLEVVNECPEEITQCFVSRFSGQVFVDLR